MSLKQTIKLTFATVIYSLISYTAVSSESTNNDWNKLLSSKKLPASNQAYCYTDEQGKTQGKNIDMKVRLASVSKLMTSLWATEKLGPEYLYNTKLYILGNSLHISGSLDPFLGNEKMFFLISQLNELGYTKFDKITFDNLLLINPSAQVHTDQYPSITRETNAKYLRLYFNTAAWSSAFKEEYTRIASLAKKGKFIEVVKFEIKEASFLAENPFINNAETRMLTLSSPPLYKYLKEINVKSNNYAIHTIFRQLGGEKAFQAFMAERYNLTSEKIRFWTGSGLPVVTEGTRKDNYATCSVVAELIAALKESSERQGKELEDVVAVPGSDGGTFRNRIISSDYKNAFVAKTGTLMHTSTLAGAMNTQKGYSFFGVFNQSTDIPSSKIVQNAMVKSIMTEMGGPLAFAYNVEGFHTYGIDGVKNLDSLFDEPSDFLPFEQNLY